MTARGCTREGWEEDERSSLVARVPLVFPVVRHGAVRGDARRRPARGLLARIDVLRHRCALPRVRGAERAEGTPNPPAAMPWCMNRRTAWRRAAAAAAGSCVPRGATPPATAGRWHRLRDVRGERTRSAPRARRAPRRTRAGAVNAPPDPPGGRTMAAPRAAPDASPSVPSARGVPRREMPLQALKSLQTSRVAFSRSRTRASLLPETSVPVLRSARRARRAG